MLGSPEATPFDLSFSVLGIPIRVTGWFWLMAAILGWSSIHRGTDYLLAWMLVCFVSILVHELGHALVASGFGFRPRITLYQMGGVAQYQSTRGHTLGRSIIISFAGPLAGFLLYGVVFLLNMTVLEPLRLQVPPRLSLLLKEIVQDLLWVNLWWGILNLLPVLPLDGGQICRDTCLIINPRQGLHWATMVSIVVAFGTAWYAYQFLGTYSALLFVILGVENLTSLQNRRTSW